MIPVHFPQHNFKIEPQGGREMIFDAFRKQWVVLTPEEWVRQNFLQWLVEVMQYPSSLISVEREILLVDLRKRFDIAVYSRTGKPWMLIECKAMDVPLSDDVFQQILRYNQTLEVRYLVITNGSFTKGFELYPEIKEVAQLPPFEN